MRDVLIKKIFHFCLSTAFIANFAMADIVDELDSSTTAAPENPDLVTETINKISPSQRVFIITNNNQAFDKGDFISLVLTNSLVARAVTAKLTDGIAGIKIVKIYSPELWKTLRPGLQIQILRGDDSYFYKTENQDDDNDSSITTDDDLYNSTVISDDNLTINDNKNRCIKTDNILSLGYGLISGVDNKGNQKSYGHVHAQWGYQFDDNIWGEFAYGQNLINDYPNAGNAGLDTRLTSITIRLKYTLAAPFYSYIQPYLGYQIVDASSPGAGNKDPNFSTSNDTLAKELEMVEKLKKNGPIFGITVLKRLVPGWFAKLDVGTDIMTLGLSLEF